MSFTLIHPGTMASDDIENAFDGIDQEHVETLKQGLPVLTTESDETLSRIERQIVRSVLSITDPSKKAWAAFFDPDAEIQMVSSTRKGTVAA